ncbi:(deoxy)nucleoside triphosphate pyrophosphohydrolase [Helcobacillus massiliensis]|uniref:(deoxy)nucleoside triphosphate pyrophosphohydrolase n=1 Tax=Helcobacillus massiliensis TaxID=521392 RepID=UPI0025570943|nr:(deoxy)nucleoside triphosphate pyrophosphohydrolase [Helcobacillus massiliensis]MDK7742836.1 (deoxy)nucleoside triphosphate pyrophosphohydrolase [Helcobacillus massiliensis]WOO94067.1 (deoxy)nucleoside triphosphate pyrophosphohydrolase [Helcobacillus massiliensis]
MPAAHRPEPLVVVAAAIQRNGAFLCARKAPGTANAGLWEFPGGKVDPGETDAAALIREIREELGCSITVGDRVSATVTPGRRRAVELRVYTCALTGDAPTSSTDHDAMQWVHPSDLPHLAWAPADLDAVRILSGGAAPA